MTAAQPVTTARYHCYGDPEREPQLAGLGAKGRLAEHAGLADTGRFRAHSAPRRATGRLSAGQNADRVNIISVASSYGLYRYEAFPPTYWRAGDAFAAAFSPSEAMAHGRKRYRPGSRFLAFSSRER